MRKFEINENLSFSLDTSKTHLNNNIALIGAAGSGKTVLNTYNIMNLTDRSHVIVDVKGNLSGLLGHFEKMGYKTYHLNLTDLDHSDTYSLFSYVDPENIELNLMTIASVIYGKTTSYDPFWDQAAIKLLTAILCGIFEMYDAEKRDLYLVNDFMELFYAGKDLEATLNKINVYYPGDSRKSLFCKSLKTALPLYSEKTRDSILQTLSTKINILLKRKVCTVISNKGIYFDDFFNHKTCIIITLDDSDSTLHPIAGLFLTQLFQYIFRKCRVINSNKLSIPLQVHLDDFGSYFINEFPNIISTARSRNIGISCLFQSQGSLKRYYGVDSETIMQNFDRILYFGGVDPDTTNLIMERSGYSKEYIARQKLHTCYIYERGKAIQYEEVLDLSSFKEPLFKQHDVTRMFKCKEENLNFLNHKTIKKLYLKLSEAEEILQEKKGHYHWKDIKIELFISVLEAQFLDYFVKNTNLYPNSVLLNDLEYARCFRKIIPVANDIPMFEIHLMPEEILSIRSFIEGKLNQENSKKNCFDQEIKTYN